MKTVKREELVVTAFGDHEVIVPPNRLRGAWVDEAPDGSDPVARAEQALAALSDQFSAWMQAECARLDAARREMRARGANDAWRERLFHAAHDIKGQAETLGFPLAAATAASLCRLLEGTADPASIPMVLVDGHADAIKAIVREHALPHAEAMASELTARLREATDEFLSRCRGSEVAADPVARPPTAPSFSAR